METGNEIPAIQAGKGTETDIATTAERVITGIAHQIGAVTAMRGVNDHDLLDAMPRASDSKATSPGEDREKIQRKKSPENPKSQRRPRHPNPPPLLGRR